MYVYIHIFRTYLCLDVLYIRGETINALKHARGSYKPTILMDSGFSVDAFQGVLKERSCFSGG